MVAPVVAAAGLGALGDLAGGLVDQYFAQKASDKSYKFQKKVLQNQVQWRVADAVKAGLHPLAALGVNPASGPSVSVGGSGIGAALSSMGQNIGRAAEAYLTPADKIAARSALLGLEQQQANIDLTKSQIAGAQKALLSSGSTPGIASRISTGKSDKLGGASVYANDQLGRAVPIPPGATAQFFEDQFGEAVGDTAGVSRASSALFDWARNVGVWPGVLGY